MADEEPAKMSLTNLRTARTVEAQFNPTEISAKVSANYEDLAILGHSSKPQQWKGVDNVVIPVELFFDRLTDQGGGGGGKNFDATRRYLLSLLYPAATGSVLNAGAPDVLFVWPNLYSLVCRVRTWEEKHMRMARDGRSTLMTVKLELHQFREFRVLGSDIEDAGLEGGLA